MREGRSPALAASCSGGSTSSTGTLIEVMPKTTRGTGGGTGGGGGACSIVSRGMVPSVADVLGTASATATGTA